MTAILVKQVENIAIYELLGTADHDRIEAMLTLYAGLFPQYKHYVPRMRRRAGVPGDRSGGHVLHYWLIEVDGRPAGLRVFRYIRSRHCGLAHALAVDPEYRKVTVEGIRLSIFIIYECLAQIIQDAQRLMDPMVLGMVNEVDSKNLMDHYLRHGLIHLPIEYVEPIFPPEQAGRDRQAELAGIRFSPMMMGFLPNPRFDVSELDQETIRSFAEAYLVDHYGLAADHPAVLQVIGSIHVQEQRQ